MARAVKLSEDLHSLTDLKRQASDLVDHATRTGRPVVLTRHGKGVAVLLSLEAYEELEASSERAVLQAAVTAAHHEYDAGRYIDGDKVDSLLAEWAGRD